MGAFDFKSRRLHWVMYLMGAHRRVVAQLGAPKAQILRTPPRFAPCIIAECGITNCIVRAFAAMSLVIQIHGKAITVRPTPMQKLENVVQEVLSSLGLHLQDCRVECQGSALDLALPFRFANLPRGAKISVHIGREPRLGVCESPTPTPTTAASLQTPASASSTSSGGLAAPKPSGSGVSQAALVGKPPSEAVGASAPAASSAPPTSDAQDAPVPKEESATDRAVHEIFGQAAIVFSEAEERSADAASSSVAADAEPDEFYEFTEGDYLVVMAGYASQREPPQMETKQMRQRREDDRAASFKTVRLRLHLPEGLVVQSDFGSSATVADLRAFAGRAFALPPASAASLELWVSPPRTALKPPSLTLYQAGLSPAARVHVGLASGEQSALRPDLFQLLSPPPPRGGSGEGRGGEVREPSAERAREQAKPSVESSSKPGGRVVPRWMQRR